MPSTATRSPVFAGAFRSALNVVIPATGQLVLVQECSDKVVRIESDRKTLCAELDCTQSKQEENWRGVTLVHQRTGLCRRFAPCNMKSMLAAFKRGKAL